MHYKLKRIPGVFYSLFLICFILGACASSKKGIQKEYPGNNQVPRISETDLAPVKLKDANRMLLEKYAKYLNASPDSLNIKLYAFIDEWLNTPYKWGGTDKSGIDCSSFVQRLFKDVYNLNLPRTSVEQLLTERVEPFRLRRYLAEGDILFFRTMPNRTVSHVGMYLCNNMFVNCSSSNGVSIASLDDIYWNSRYVISGRVKASFARR